MKVAESLKKLWALLILVIPFCALCQTEQKSKPIHAKYEVISSAAFTYTVTLSTDTYKVLSGAVSLNENQLWEDPGYTIPVSFNFKLFNFQIDSLDFGYGVGGILSGTSLSDSTIFAVIAPFDTDLMDRGGDTGVSQSPISYITEGDTGSRILKIEWENAGSYDEWIDNGTLNDFVSFQLWLYEATNDIEIHFGPNQITDPFTFFDANTGPAIGIMMETNIGTQSDVHFLFGTPDNIYLKNTYSFLTGMPQEGTIYKFSKIPVSVEASMKQQKSLVFPNPVLDYLNVKMEIAYKGPAAIWIYDISGRLVYRTTINAESSTIDISSLQQGMYMMHIIAGEALQVLKIIKE